MDITRLLQYLERIDQIEKLLLQISQQIENNKKDEIGGITMAAEITGLSTHRIYQLVSKRQIPFSRVDGVAKLFFQRQVLIDWITKKK